MKILVCGGAGFIGSNFIQYILQTYPKYEIVNFDKLTYAGNLDNLKDVADSDRYTFVKGDVAHPSDIEAVFEAHKPDAVINFAAETHNDRSVHGEAAAFAMTNFVGVQTILDAVQKYGTDRFVHVSTDEVYGELELEDERSFAIDDPFLPNSPYSAAKAGGDMMCRAYFRSFNTPVIVTHCTNNYGPYQYPEKLIPFFTARAMHDKTLPLYGNGRNIRDWIYVIDHCRGLDLALHKGRSGETYNFDADSERSNIEIAHAILDILGKSKDLITFIEDRPGHDMRYSLDAAKAHTELEWEPLHDFESMLRKTIEWYGSNQWWIDNLNERGAQLNKHIEDKPALNDRTVVEAEGEATHQTAETKKQESQAT